MAMSDHENVGFIFSPASDERTKKSIHNLVKRRDNGSPEVSGMTKDKSLLSSWEIRFEAFNMNAAFNVTFEDDDAMVLGVARDKSVVNLQEYFRDILGVSHLHLKVFSVGNELFVEDQNSANGTRLNGRSIEPGKSYHIYSGDFVELGNLVLTVNILRSPKDNPGVAGGDYSPSQLVDHLSSLIASGLELNNVLVRLLEISVKLTQADRASIWLADQDSSNLFLKAEFALDGNPKDTASVSFQDDDPIIDVLRDGRSLQITSKTKRPLKFFADTTAGAVLYLPLFLGEKPIGVLSVIKNSAGSSFPSKDENAIRLLGKFIAIALREHKSQELTELAAQKKIEEYLVYQNILQSLFKQNDLTGIYGELRELLRHRWSVENVGMWLLDELSNTLVPFPQPSFHKNYVMGEDLIGSVAVQSESVMKNNVKIFAGTKDAVEPTLQLLARSVVCAPLIVGDKTIGVLAMFSLKEDQFTKNDAKLFGVYSQAAAEVVQKIQLFDQIRKQKATILAAVNMLQHPMLIINHEGKLIMSNKAANIMIGELQSRLSAVKDVSSRATTSSLASFLNELSRSKSNSREIVVGDKVYVATLESASMVGTIILLQDVTDPVTGVFSNHHYHVLADQAFVQAKRYRKSLAALVIGFTDFHKVLEVRGYAVGNQILKELAIRLRSCLRTSDVLGRYQEDNFITFLPETDLASAKITAERILDQLRKDPISVEKNQSMAKLTVGGALLDFNNDASINDLITRASKAFSSAMVDKKSKIKFSEQ